MFYGKSTWICDFWTDAWKKVKHIFPNGGLMVIYYDTK